MLSFAAIPSVYALSVPETLVGGFIDSVMSALTAAARVMDLAVPSACYGSKLDQLIGAAVAPWGVIGLAAVAWTIRNAAVAHAKG